jgi:hypothetical protein
MLGYAYENALVTENLRRERGIFYTPRIVTNQVLGRLPIESIQENRRVILDPCCGSGSFLLAGFERLNELLPRNWTSARRHQYLRARLVGRDLDDFATEVASLSLVVTDPLNRNGWQVAQGDVTELQLSELHSRPTIVVTNPPFREIKTKGSGRKELASEVLVKLVDLLAPSGLLGVIVPQSMLDSRAGLGARQAVLDNCDLIEIDTLPGGLFQSAAETGVIFARKHEKSATRPKAPLITVRELRASDLPKFRAYGAYTATYSVTDERWRLDPARRFIISPFGDLWAALQKRHRRLGDIADVRTGLQVRSDDTTSVSDIKRPEDVPYLEKPNVIRPFAILKNDHHLKWLHYGDQLHRRREEALFASPKVLIASNRKPGNIWRLVAAPVRETLFFSENFHAIIPRSAEVTLEELLAVLNSPVANAWFDAHSKKRWVVQSVLEDLPFPEFDAASKSRIQTLVPRLERAVIAHWRRVEEGLFYDGDNETFDSGMILDEIDSIVHGAYGITRDEERQLIRYMSSDKRPG